MFDYLEIYHLESNLNVEQNFNHELIANNLRIFTAVFNAVLTTDKRITFFHFFATIISVYSLNRSGD